MLFIYACTVYVSTAYVLCIYKVYTVLYILGPYGYMCSSPLRMCVCIMFTLFPPFSLTTPSLRYCPPCTAAETHTDTQTHTIRLSGSCATSPAPFFFSPLPSVYGDQKYAELKDREREGILIHYLTPLFPLSPLAVGQWEAGKVVPARTTFRRRVPPTPQTQNSSSSHFQPRRKK